MKTFKPMKLGVLTRTFELDRKHYFIPTILVLFEIRPERRLLADPRQTLEGRREIEADLDAASLGKARDVPPQR